MTMKPVRAFAPVKDGVIDIERVSPSENHVKAALGWNPFSARFLKARGWRIRPVLVTLETSND